MARGKKIVAVVKTEETSVMVAATSPASRDVSTAAALESAVSTSEDDSDASEALAEEVAATKRQATQKVKAEKVEPQPPQPPAPADPSAPLPNLGYACLNVTLRNDGKKPSIFNNRTCRLATLKQKGLEFVSGLALQNCQDLLPILQWNAAHGIKLMRLSSEFFPWGNVHYKLCELPDYEGIKAALAAAGEYARETGQRLTTHPSEFTKLAGTSEDVVAKTIADLELHSELFDLLGFEPSPYNKINIHVGGTYDGKEKTLQRFAANFRKLSPNCQARLTVENDDRASMFSVRDLLRLHDMCAPHLPIVFDFHHWRFCTGDMTSEEALRAAVGTWPKGVRPVVHWSESQGGKIAHAHSDYIGQQGRLNLHGMDAEIDVMIESKAKELSILLYRDIIQNGLAGREMFFQGIDEIEEEATRVEVAKAAGEAVELEPLPTLELEGAEIIPVNDKRLHGRSQRRNKAQAAARAASSKLASQQSGEGAVAGAEPAAAGDTPSKPAKRQRKTKSQGSDGAAAGAEPSTDGDTPSKPRKPRRSKEEIEAEKAQKAAAKVAREAARAQRAAAKAEEKATAQRIREEVAAEVKAAREEKAAAAKALKAEQAAAAKAAALAALNGSSGGSDGTVLPSDDPPAADLPPAVKPGKSASRKRQAAATVAAEAGSIEAVVAVKGKIARRGAADGNSGNGSAEPVAPAKGKKRQAAHAK